MSGSAGELRQILGHFATGVTVLTTVDHTGEIRGTTANAFTSVSLDPPLVLVCLAEESETLGAIEARGAFAANILAGDQQEHSDFFSRRGVRLDPDRYGIRFGDLGMPVLEGILAHLECEVERVDAGGDHRIVLGRVRAHERHREAVDPLLFFRGGYGLPEATSMDEGQ